MPLTERRTIYAGEVNLASSRVFGALAKAAAGAGAAGRRLGGHEPHPWDSIVLGDKGSNDLAFSTERREETEREQRASEEAARRQPRGEGYAKHQCLWLNRRRVEGEPKRAVVDRVGPDAAHASACPPAVVYAAGATARGLSLSATGAGNPDGTIEPSTDGTGVDDDVVPDAASSPASGAAGGHTVSDWNDFGKGRDRAWHGTSEEVHASLCSRKRLGCICCCGNEYATEDEG